MRMGEELAGGGARLVKQKYVIGLFISTIQMLWISIEILLRPAIGVLLRPTGYIFLVLACLYMAFAEATTDKI